MFLSVDERTPWKQGGIISPAINLRHFKKRPHFQISKHLLAITVHCTLTHSGKPNKIQKGLDRWMTDWITWAGPESNDKCPYHTWMRMRQRHSGEGHVGTDTVLQTECWDSHPRVNMSKPSHQCDSVWK